MTIAAPLLDVDGVIVAPPFRFARWLEANCGLAAVDTSAFFQGPFVECVAGRKDLKDALSPFPDGWGWRDGVDAFLAHWFDVECELDADLVDRVQSLRRARLSCYLATTQERYRLRYMRNEMGCDRLFDGIFASCEVGYLKPDPRFFHAVAEALCLPAGELVLWDDSERNVEAARAYGWKAGQYLGFRSFTNHPLTQIMLAALAHGLG
jgi:putative hydrolase of the HAD superfamily